jgi:hypothetical protein
VIKNNDAQRSSDRIAVGQRKASATGFHPFSSGRARRL